jgi:ribonuclease HI
MLERESQGGRGHGGDEDVAAVLRRELSLLTAEYRADPARVRSLLHPDFREFGASGRVWDRTTVAGALAPESPITARAEEVVPVRLADDVVLVTYRAVASGVSSLRSSVWVRSAQGAWLLRFHQGTRIGSE